MMPMTSTTTSKIDLSAQEEAFPDLTPSDHSSPGVNPMVTEENLAPLAAATISVTFADGVLTEEGEVPTDSLLIPLEHAEANTHQAESKSCNEGGSWNLEKEMLQLENEMLKEENEFLKGENKPLQEEFYQSRQNAQRVQRELSALKNVRKIDELCDILSKDEKQYQFFTGLSFSSFRALQALLGSSVHNLKLWKGEKDATTRKTRISPDYQLILTLVQCRQGDSIQFLSYQFLIAYDLIRRLFVTWIQLLYKQFNMLRDFMYAPRHRHHPLPKALKNSLLNRTRIVLDCTEIKVETSRHYTQQGNLFSTYKSHATTKILIGCAPSGACMFCSEAFEGSISDKAIVEKSKVMDYIEEGDQVVVDRGFTIEEQVVQKGGQLVIMGKK